jgi:hypothetical protein
LTTNGEKVSDLVCGRRESTLNAKHSPDIGKGNCERATLCLCDDQADTERGEGRSGLDKHRGNAGISSGQLWSEYLACERAHAQEAKADERRDEHIEADAQRDPRHPKVCRFSVEQERIGQGALNNGDDYQNWGASTIEPRAPNSMWGERKSTDRRRPSK